MAVQPTTRGSPCPDNSTTPSPPQGPRRSDAGVVRLGQRDIDGLIMLAEHYAAPYDLLAAALGAQPARLRGITARWRRAGYAAAAATLTLPAIYAAVVLARQHDQPSAALAPARDYPTAWHHLAALGAARTFVALAASVEVLANPTRRPATRWRPRTPWCRPAVRCTAPRASSATWCLPTR